MPTENKVALMVCGGIGRLVSTVVRQAAHMVATDRPENVVVVSSGALTGDVPEAIETVSTCRLIAVDACQERCASAIVAGKHLDAEETIWLPDLAAKYKLSLAGEDRKGLTGKGLKLSRALADEIIERVDAIVDSGTGD